LTKGKQLQEYLPCQSYRDDPNLSLPVFIPLSSVRISPRWFVPSISKPYLRMNIKKIGINNTKLSHQQQNIVICSFKQKWPSKLLYSRVRAFGKLLMKTWDS